jgi:hypothetical protein
MKEKVGYNNRIYRWVLISNHNNVNNNESNCNNNDTTTNKYSKQV